MAVRICPHCKNKVAGKNISAFTGSIVCPHCEARLEVSPGARTVSSFLGLIAGAVAWRLSSNSGGALGGVLPTVYAFLAFGVVSPLVLMLTANLRNAPALPEPAAVAPAVGHAGGHH